MCWPAKPRLACLPYVASRRVRLWKVFTLAQTGPLTRRCRVGHCRVPSPRNARPSASPRSVKGGLQAKRPMSDVPLFARTDLPVQQGEFIERGPQYIDTRCIIRGIRVSELDRFKKIFANCSSCSSYVFCLKIKTSDKLCQSNSRCISNKRLL